MAPESEAAHHYHVETPASASSLASLPRSMSPGSEQQQNMYQGMANSESQKARAAQRARTILIQDEWSPRRKLLARAISHPVFEVAMCLVTLLNFVLVVHETDIRASSKLGRQAVPMWIDALHLTFLGVYTADVACRTFVLRRAILRDRWGLLDIFIIVSDLLIELVGNVWSNIPSVSALRIVKVARFLRFLETVRTVQAFRELYILLHGFVSAMRAIVWCTVLLGSMLCVWALVAVELLNDYNQEIAESGYYDGCDRCERAFSSVSAAILTFTQQIVAGDSWGLVSLPIIEAHPWTVVLFLSVLISIDMGLLNLILTVIVDRAAQARTEDTRFLLHQRAQEFEAAKKHLLRLCAQLDTDESGNLSKEELLHGFDNEPEFADAMRLMDVQRDDLSTLYSILDEDASGDVAYEEFVEQLHRMKSQDTQMILVFIRSYVKDVKKHVQDQSVVLEKQALRLEGLEKMMRRQEKLSARMVDATRALGATTSEPTVGRVGGLDQGADAAAGHLSHAPLPGKPPLDECKADTKANVPKFATSMVDALTEASLRDASVTGMAAKLDMRDVTIQQELQFLRHQVNRDFSLALQGVDAQMSKILRRVGGQWGPCRALKAAGMAKTVAADEANDSASLADAIESGSMMPSDPADGPSPPQIGGRLRDSCRIPWRREQDRPELDPRSSAPPRLQRPPVPAVNDTAV
mmetsp:Transcript_31243/g.85788  ORF Transcript_31243/g.85788 Transcript_31243/m.85788 type:complete len:695 (+) Transcript_31243:68-2152(+)